MLRGALTTIVQSLMFLSDPQPLVFRPVREIAITPIMRNQRSFSGLVRSMHVDDIWKRRMGMETEKRLEN